MGTEVKDETRLELATDRYESPTHGQRPISCYFVDSM